jgi:steroid 5-alpha reductase family enzyme
MFDSILTAAAVVFAYIAAFYVLAQVRKNNGLVDIAWGLGFILLSAVLFFRSPVHDPAKILILALLALWGFRLAGHIFRRNFGKPEDFRYANMRKKWGKAAPVKSFFFVFMLQGVLMLIVSSPAIVVMSAPARPIRVLDALGALIFLFGLSFEAIADRQLAAHVRNPANKGKLMIRGLWSYSRHPNYFGEAALWWGLGLIAASSKDGWAGFVGPLVITLLLRFVSGVPLLEKKYAGRSDWEDYKKTTPIFVPRF